MKKRYNKIIVDGEARYTVEVKEGLFKPWRPMSYTFTDDNDKVIKKDVTQLNIEEIGSVCKWFCYENGEINRDLQNYLRDVELGMHSQPYHVTKYRSKDSRIIDTLCMADSLEGLYEELGKLIGKKSLSEDTGEEYTRLEALQNLVGYVCNPIMQRKEPELHKSAMIIKNWIENE